MQKNSRETLKFKEIKVQWEGNIFLGISGSELAVLLVTGNFKKNYDCEKNVLHGYKIIISVYVCCQKIKTKCLSCPTQNETILLKFSQYTATE